MTRPARYTENGSSRDWIDEFCATSTTEEVRGAFRFTIGKYLRRYGKKDDPLQEAIKIQDYANRLVEFEQAALLATAKPVMPADFGQQHTIEPASLIDDESPRQQAIGQNGNGGEHYASTQTNWPDWSTHRVVRIDSALSGSQFSQECHGAYLSVNGKAFNMNRWRVVEQRP